MSVIYIVIKSNKTMTQKEIISNFKFYHNESECPYTERIPEAYLWEAEQRFNSLITDQDTLDGWFDMTKQIKERKPNCRLNDKLLQNDAQRVILLYVDSWLSRRRKWKETTIELWLKA